MADVHVSEGDAPPPKPAREHWFRSLRRHAIFPILVYIVVSMVLKENYPFSHFPMYSKPTARPLSYSYIADGTGRGGALGEPVPLLYYTGLTPSALHKSLGHYKGRYEKDESLSKEEIASRAGADVLEYVRERNAPRQKWGSKRFLPETIQYVRVRISYGDGTFIETPEVIAVNTEPEGGE